MHLLAASEFFIEKMTNEQWQTFRPYFTARECGEGMDFDFMVKVLAFRKLLGFPMYILCGYDTSGHAEKSYHYQGRALDFWCNWDVRHVMALIDKMGFFHGAGLYYWGAHRIWYHIDDRPIDRYQRWISLKKGDYIYFIEEWRV